MLSTHQIATLHAAKAAGALADRALPEAELPAHRFFAFLYDEHWSDNPATIERIRQAVRALQSNKICMWQYCHSELAEQMPLTRALVAEEVPFVAEFADYLLAEKRRQRSRPQHWLDFLICQTHLAAPEDVGFFFSEIADVLQNRLVVQTGNATFRITELEFYYHGRNHPDPFVHKGEEQLRHLHWYFNKATSLDLTFGDANTGSHGGILLRGLEELGAEKGDSQSKTFPYTVGPQLALRALVASWHAAFEGANCLRLQENPAPFEPSATPWRTARVGLNASTEAPDAADPYHARPYRFLAGKGYLKHVQYKEKICRELALDPVTIREILGYSPAWL